MTPPFQSLSQVDDAPWRELPLPVPLLPVDNCCSAGTGTTASGRTRLIDLDPHLHCSVIGTCMSTAELRRLMASFMSVAGATDLEVHHEAVRLAGEDPEVSRLLHKALERRHDAVVQRFRQAKDSDSLQALWEEALHAGEVPGAYWALLTHRRATFEMRQQAFGEVHMLSHLVGAANRADVRRLVAIERENAELRERLDRLQLRLDEAAREREQLQAERAALAGQLRARDETPPPPAGDELPQALARIESLSAALALQTLRTGAAERVQADAQEALTHSERERLRLQEQMDELARELTAAEAQLHEAHADGDGAGSRLHRLLGGRRVLYVGGRPSTSTAIRNLVARLGAEYQRHDGGIEDRKGLLQPALAWADLVVFPVDCIDHDSALALKRACQRQGTRFVPLRSASVASFAAGVVAAMAAGQDAPPPPLAAGGGLCCRHA